MPDWFYRTVSRPALFRLPAATARDFALGFMGRLARLPLGPSIIDFLGHMRADPRLTATVGGVAFPTRVGLGSRLDVRATALPALARFGVGFLVVGPVTAGGSGNFPVERDDAAEAIHFPGPPQALGVAEAGPRIAEAARLGLPVIVRIGDGPGDDVARVVRELAPHAGFVALPHAAPAPVPVLIVADADADLPAGAAGWFVEGCVKGVEGLTVGAPVRAAALALVAALRRRNERAVIVAGGGVHEPADAVALLAAGADLVTVDSGLVFTGPGLPKRINEALLFAATRGSPPPTAERAPEMSWFWAALLGAGMLFGSLLALTIAATRVVLPYDEAFVGMTRAELDAINPRLLAFMTHDRVSLAGTMIAVGMVYVGLSLFGVRAGLHWAQQTIFVSAFTGFAGFFLFLGYGYLDPFHAFVSAAMLQLLLLAVHARLREPVPGVEPPPRTDRAWRRAQWGQLLLVIHGFALLTAGAVISYVGVTHVFVHSDLEFMGTTAEALAAANPRLVPLVAHDRASFGGMLLASGWAFLLPVLWGFRTGSAWLWWTLLTSGLAAYVAALGVHYAVGYTEWMHLVPAYAGLTLLVGGLALAQEYLCARPSPTT